MYVKWKIPHNDKKIDMPNNNCGKVSLPYVQFDGFLPPRRHLPKHPLVLQAGDGKTGAGSAFRTVAFTKAQPVSFSGEIPISRAELA